MIWGPGPARARSICEDPARARPANWIMRPGPGPTRPAKQFNMWGPGPARARGPRAGLLARSHRHTKQQLYYCVHILMWQLSCYVRNHMHFQCLCEVYIMDIVHERYLFGESIFNINYLCMTFSLESSILLTSWLPGFARASPSLLLPPHSLLLSTLPPSDYPASPRIFAV